EVTLTYGQYRAILATNRHQADRAAAFDEYHKLYELNGNTYASLYHGVLERDWFHAQARGYKTTLEAALHGNNIPPAVVENLIETTKAGTAPLRRYHRLRKRVLGLDSYHTYDGTVPLVDLDHKYPYEQVLDWLPASVAPLGDAYRTQLRDVLSGDWIDVYENRGKRSGAYSAPCSRWRTRWAIRCTRCCRTPISRSSTPRTRSSSPRCRRRSAKRCSWTTCWRAPRTIANGSSCSSTQSITSPERSTPR